MLKNSINCDLLQCRVYRPLFLAVFALSPIVDAYSDSLCSPLVFLNGQNDADDPVITQELNLNDNLISIQAKKDSKKVSRHYHALLQTPIEYVPACGIDKIQLSANIIKASQICSPISSGLSPPAVSLLNLILTSFLH